MPVATALSGIFPAENREYFRNRVAQWFGSTRFAFAFDDFTDAVIGAKWQLNPPLVNPPALDNTFNGGFVKFTNDSDIIFKSNNSYVRAPKTVKWAVGGRVVFDSVAGLNNGEERVIALRTDNQNYAAVGLIKDLSATKFAFKTVVTNVVVSGVSTVNLDTNVHDWFLLHDPVAGLYGVIDEEAPVLVSALQADIFAGPFFERHGLQTPTAPMYLDAVFCAIQSTGT